MGRLVVGLLVGLVLGAATGVAAGQRVVGSSGYLIGWTVTVDGDDVCDDPYVWTGTREIECD